MRISNCVSKVSVMVRFTSDKLHVSLLLLCYIECLCYIRSSADMIVVGGESGPSPMGLYARIVTSYGR